MRPEVMVCVVIGGRAVLGTERYDMGLKKQICILILSRNTLKLFFCYTIRVWRGHSFSTT